MPTYQYACLDCAENFEVRQSFTDPSLTECPVCEGPLRKVFNAVGIVFKGSGFYRTDSRKTADDAPAKVNGTKDSATEKTGSGDAKSDKSGEKSPASGDKSSANESPTAAASTAASARP